VSRPSERAVRLTLGAIGLIMLAYGTLRILQFPKVSKPVHLAEWLVAAIVVHDGVLAPIVAGIGWVLARAVPGRARSYLQGGLIVAAVLSLFVVVLNHRHGHSAPGNALLTQDYVRNWAILVPIVAAVTAGLYAVRVIRERRTTR
jgi:multisubunit Na+/H+ antiporter MnhB subunit